MSSRIHHTEVSQRGRLGIALGWVSLALLLVGLLIYAGNSIVDRWTWAILGVGVALGIAYLALRKDAVVALIVHPSTGARANNTAFVIGVLGVLALCNYISYRHYRQTDLTKNQMYTLSPQTKEVVKGLKDDITITAFYPKSGQAAADGDRARDLLRQYRDISPKIKYDVIDPLRDKAKAEQKIQQSGYRLTSYPIMWVECGTKKEDVYQPSEQDLTSALMKVTRTTKKKIYFLYGHGEHDIDDAQQQDGLGLLKTLLTDRLNYDVSKLILRTVGDVPSDATLVVAAGPADGLPAEDQKKLNAYLEKGGKLLLLIDPRTPAPEELLKPWGVEVGNDVVVDPRIKNDCVAVVQGFEPHVITKNLQVAYFRFARSVTAATSAPSGVVTAPLAKTPAFSWAQTRLAGPYQKKPGDKDGPISLAVAVSKEINGAGPDSKEPKKSMRMVVIGDSDFATNGELPADDSHGRYFLLNSINWLTEEDALVNIPPKDPDSGDQISLLDNQARWIFIITILVIPLGVLLSGVALWWRRR